MCAMSAMTLIRSAGSGICSIFESTIAGGAGNDCAGLLTFVLEVAQPKTAPLNAKMTQKQVVTRLLLSVALCGEFFEISIVCTKKRNQTGHQIT
jgi:hypothetical protein